MEVGMSLLITIPDELDRVALLDLGIRACPYEEVSGMDAHEAIKWAMYSLDGMRELHGLGITWEVEETGRGMTG